MFFYTKEALSPLGAIYFNREKYFTNQAMDFSCGKCMKVNMFENIGWLC